MKLSEYRVIGRGYTEKASEITRQLSLGGIAIVWIFKNADGDYPVIDYFLIFPLILLSISLLLDLIHYLWGGHIWIRFFREEEKKTNPSNPDPEVKAPSGKSTPLYVLYYAKITLMGIAYLLIIGYLIGKLFVPIHLQICI
jgi:hypothetical protein